MAKRVRGNFNPELIQGGLRQGDSNIVLMFAGSAPTSGHIVIFDANGNATDGGSAAGTVTNTGGALTADQPMFGAGGNNSKVGTKTGNTDQVVTGSGAATSGYPLLYDANGNAIAAKPRGNTTTLQCADSSVNPTTGNTAKFDANGNIADAGVAPAQTIAAATNKFLTAYSGATGAFTAARPADADLSVSDITTNNASTAAHGFAPKLPNDSTKYLNGVGAWAVPASGGGGGITYGARASLPATPGAAGTYYVCTDSPFTYVSNGSAWLAFVNGTPCVEPALSDYTLINPAATTVTSNTTLGGIAFSCSIGSGDKVACYVRPVTPSSTLKVAMGFARDDGTGLVIYNANNNAIVFIRYAGNPQLWYYSRYTSGSWVSNPATTVPPTTDWPLHTFLLTFDGTSWFFRVAMDPNAAIMSKALLNETLAAYLGTNYTHVGFGANANNSTCWMQHYKVIST